MFVRQIRAQGGDRNFSYIIADETSGDAAVIDPGSPPSTEREVLEAEGLRLRYIINTHDHFDHTGGNAELAAATGARVVMFEDAGSAHDIGVGHDDSIELGGVPLHIIHTPGHTPDSICVLVGGDVFTGDTLFVGKVGGTGFGRDAREEYESLHGRLMTLPPETRVWPGHDYGVRPSSTIGTEMKENPFILRGSFEDFVDLKRNWAEYKRAHGIA